MNAGNYNGEPGACAADPVGDLCGACGEWIEDCHCTTYDEDDAADERLDREREERD